MAARRSPAKCVTPWTSARREQLREVEVHRLFKLPEAARARVAVIAPPNPLGCVPEPGPFHVLVPDLDDPLGPQRHERQILLRVPPAALGRPRVPGPVLLCLLSAPVPRMALERGDERLDLGE